MRRLRYGSHWLTVLVALLLAGCVSAPYENSGSSSSDALLQKQFAAADLRRSSAPQGRFIFAGFAMHSQSRASRSDVLAAERTVLAIDPNATIFKLNNPVQGQEADWPYATSENVSQVLRKVAEIARPTDRVIILFSSHGNRNRLLLNFDNRNYPPISAAALAQSLTGLKDTPTLLLVSSCYSGSFVEPLANPRRIILTAAAQDRSSFGCQFNSSNTYFVDALLNQSGLMSRTLVQAMEHAKVEIDQRERRMKYSPPSMPQAYIGNAVAVWANTPVNRWLQLK
jgi:hypothetical protein